MKGKTRLHKGRRVRLEAPRKATFWGQGGVHIFVLREPHGGGRQPTTLSQFVSRRLFFMSCNFFSLRSLGYASLWNFLGGLLLFEVRGS